MITGLEILNEEDSGLIHEHITAIQNNFLEEGYYKIPDDIDYLFVKIRELILEFGYANEPLEKICREACLAGGMKKKK